MNSLTVRACGLAMALALLPACGGDEPGGEAADGSTDDNKEPSTGDNAGDNKEPAASATGPCVSKTAAGDHVFECDGIKFLTLVTPECASGSCGLIMDVHGATMSGEQMRDNTQLHELAPKEGYIVVQPSAPTNLLGGFWMQSHYKSVSKFMLEAIEKYKVDKDRVHFSGFSQGSMMTWHMLCAHKDLLASVAPAGFAPSGEPCPDGAATPVPILYMHGTTDGASPIENAVAGIEGLVAEHALTGGEDLATDAQYTRKHWSNDDGMVLDFIQHEYGGQAVLGGHCIPGGIDVPGGPHNYSTNATTCTTPEGAINLHWGKAVLAFFKEHPRSK